MRLSEHHHEIADVLHSYGIKPEIERTNGDHVRFRWVANDIAQSLVTASTPSDWRATKNEIAKVRRKLKDAGIIVPCAEAKKATPAVPVDPAARRISELEERIVRLERDVAMLLDRLTRPVEPEPLVEPVIEIVEPAAPTAPEPPAPKRRRTGRRMGDYSWLWRAMSYQDYRPLHAIVKATGKPYGRVSVILTTLKQRGYIEHRRGGGWRKHRKVEELSRR